MKYLATGAHQKSNLMKLSILGALTFLFGLWVSSFGMFFSRFTLDPETVVTYYRGSEETFQAPRTFGSMVEVTHGHMAMMAVTLLFLTHLVIFLPFSARLKVIGIAGTFVSAFLNEASGWLVRFVHPGFAPLKLVSFFASQSFQFALLVCLVIGLSQKERRKAEDPSTEPIRDTHFGTAGP